MERVLVTGANGFVGKAACHILLKNEYAVRGAVRSYESIKYLPDGVEPCVIGEIGPDTDWEKALNDVDAIVHLAGRAHVMKETVADSFAEYYRINTLGTEHLARIALKCGVSRFIYISSIKVNGEYTKPDSNGKMRCFFEESIPDPQDYYAISKWKAEEVLHKIKEESGLEIVILRPPLIYGPGVKANFLYLLKMVELGMLFPFGSVKNIRSFIYLGNFIDIISRCITDPAAAGQTFLVSDGQDVSTPDLIRKIGQATGCKSVLVPFPVGALKFLGKVSGRTREIERLTNSLCVDNRKIRKILNWNPPYTLEQGIKLTVDAHS